jgi:hypothetical protein
MSDLARSSYKRFPAERRKACVPVTSAHPNGTKKSLLERAGAQQSGVEAPPEGMVLRRSIRNQEDKGVVEK